jgi:hypothetical protein
MVRKPPRGVRESEIPCPGNAGLLSHRRRLQAADVDLLSGHRVGLDVGIDWNYVEYQARALGRDFRTRGARQGEQIQLLRRFFTQSVGDFPGRYHRADRAHSHPNRHPNLIWAGGIRRSSVRPGARLARTTRTAGAGRDGRQLLGSRSWVVRLRWKNWRLFTPARVRGFVCKNVRRMSTTIRIYPDLTVVA